jgi:hypothetical protein
MPRQAFCLYQPVGCSNLDGANLISSSLSRLAKGREKLADGVHEPVLYIFTYKTVNCHMQVAIGASRGKVQLKQSRLRKLMTCRYFNCHEKVSDILCSYCSLTARQ